jgi:two-component system, OmpR family, alkaline phosphatase synthesis response regulator PhoP
MKPLIITVEDDAVISELVEFNLRNEGYDVGSYRDGQTMLDALGGEQRPELSLFLLDIMLPGMDGIEICARIRRLPGYEDVPVIMLTARGSESDKVRALDSGADDYITKPFGVREFLARVNANVRRYVRRSGSSLRTSIPGDPPSVGTVTVPSSSSGLLESAGIRIDDERHRVFKADREIEMTNREYELLKFMMRNKGIAFSRDDLLAHVWGYEYAGETRTVDVHIRQLRRKIEEDDANPIILETVRGRGYRFTDSH